MADLPRPGGLHGDEVSDIAFLLGLLERPAWHGEAACRTAPPGVNFFPEPGESAKPAKAICAGCRVNRACREWALTQPGNIDGVWGGQSRNDRAKPRRRHRAA
jgi:WhiB family transcriptional regulator, redox-sensing transcriptional regulator